MIVIGLTGSMGMGKSTAAKMLAEEGLPVYEADAAVHKLLAPGGAGVAPVMMRFPEAYDKKKVCIDRGRLRAAIGMDHGRLDELEEILHPLVFDLEKDFLQTQAAARAKMVVLDIPLLFETGAAQRVDYTICMSAPEEIRQQRVMARPHMTPALFSFFSSRQWPDEKKKQYADFVVQTGDGLAATRRDLKKVVGKIREMGARDNNQKPRPGL